MKQPDIEFSMILGHPPGTLFHVIVTSLPAPTTIISMGCCLIWASFDISVYSISQKELALESLSPASNADISVGEVRSIL